MSLPTSPLFDLLDWNPRVETHGITEAATGAQELLDPSDIFNGITTEGLALKFSADVSSNLAAGALATATYRKLLSVPQNYTVEFDVSLPEDMPENFEDPDNRIFLGACDKQGYTAGVLISKAGLAIASSPLGSAQPILGSKKLVLNNDGTAKGQITIRSLVDGELGRLTLYVTETSEAYDNPGNYYHGTHELAASVPAEKSVLGVDNILIACRASLKNTPITLGELAPGVPAVNSSISVTSIRLSSSILVVPTKPIAVIEALPTSIVGQVTPLSAARSYDPENRELSYSWEILSAPEGSAANFEGATYAKVTIGATETDNEITFTHTAAGSLNNGITVEVVLSSVPASDLSLDLVGSVVVTGVKITLGRHKTLDQTTTAVSNLHQAITNPSSPGYNPYVSKLLKTTLGENANHFGHVPQGSFVLAGGAGSTLKAPLFIPTHTGVYSIQLKVYNGLRWSDPKVLDSRALRDDQLLGNRPNCDFIFETISDFWTLVPDAKILPSLWSSMSQVVSGELLKLWQSDFSKSISDVARYYQRRWLDYPMRLRAPSPITLTSTTYNMVTLVGTKFFSCKAYPGMVSTGLLTDRLTVQLPVSDYSEAGLSEGPAVVLSSTGEAVEVVIASIEALVALLPANPELDAAPKYTFAVMLASKSAPAYALVDSGSRGIVVPPEDAPFSLTSNNLTTHVGKFKTYDIIVGDKIRLTPSIGGDTIFRSVVAIEPVVSLPAPGPNVADNVLVLSGDPLEVDLGFFYNWEIVRYHSFVQLFQQPYYQFDKSLALEKQKFRYGDQVEIEYVEPTTSVATSSKMPILLSQGKRIYPDWRGLLSDLKLISGMTFANSGPGAVAGEIVKQFYASDNTPVPATLEKIHSAVLSSELAYVYHTEVLPIDADIVSIPNLSSELSSTDYTENDDFTISQGELNFVPQLRANAIITKAAPQSVTLTEGLLFPEEAASVIVESGECGIYSISSLSTDRKTANLTHTFSNFYSESSPVSIRVPRLSHNAAGPTRLWAELTYFDNSQTIEDNFGIYVGLKRAALSGVSVDYLSVIKAAWFAFMSGPSVYNLRLATQAFMGFPYTEYGGQLVSIRENYDDTNQREFVVSEAETGERRYYYCSSSLDIATNPRTGRPYKAFGLTDADIKKKNKAELNTGEPFVLTADQLVDKEDATVLSNEFLVNGVTIADYINDPELVSKHLGGENFVRRNHVFLISLDAQAQGDIGIHTIYDELHAFLTEIKPAYTDFIIVFSLNLFDSIDVTTSFEFNVKLHLEDGPHTAPFQKASNNHVDSDSLTTWPFDTTADNNPGVPTWTYAQDTFDKYESSYVAGVLDDSSGDGSWNQAHSIVDMVNHLESDIDVLNTKLWLPVSKVTAFTYTGDNGNVLTNTNLEFVEGEELILGVYDTSTNPDTWTTLSSCVWEKLATDANGDPIPDDNARPVLEHIGSGHHPKIPFNSYSPQNEHPITYMLLGFNRDSEEHAAGTTNRLRAVALTENPTANAVKGATSEAIAMLRGVRYEDPTARPSFDIAMTVVDPLVDPAGAVVRERHRPYFLVETVFSVDKIHDTGPQQETGFMVTQYIPDTGIEIGTFRADFDQTLASSNPTQFIHTPAPGRDLEYFEHPPTLDTFGAVAYPSTMLEEQQLVPSFGPGFFHAWDRKDISTINGSNSTNPTLVVTSENHGFSDGDTIIIEGHSVATVNGEYTLAAGAVVSNISFNIPVQGGGSNTGTVGKKVQTTDQIVYGWRDIGDITDTAPSTKFLFDMPDDVLAMKNLHIGKRELAHKSYHGTHGFTGFSIPPPVVLELFFINGMSVIRLEGNFFVAPDSTQTALPQAAASSFTGQNGGSWVFFRHRDTDVEYPCDTVIFETGLNPGKTVLGLDGATQRSDGHILDAAMPGNLPVGDYDIILRQYRPYVMSSGGTTNYHLDEIVFYNAYHEYTPAALLDDHLVLIDDDGFGEGSWGNGDWNGNW